MARQIVFLVLLISSLMASLLNQVLVDGTPYLPMIYTKPDNSFTPLKVTTTESMTSQRQSFRPTSTTTTPILLATISGSPCRGCFIENQRGTCDYSLDKCPS
ncbi:hypothetical protein SK128_009484 [Halocaridina rubra]|uniref:Uncharacterized protein n=1 Tax=Halocaridina rubra TaxID=373956 RepID=A0AAN8X8U5_HALRR